MKLGLQFGHGMLDLSKSLIRQWGEGLIILSPRDLTDNQMLSLSKSLLAAGGEIAFDPQFYIPKTDHKKLKSHPHWPSTYDTMAFWTGTQVKKLVEDLLRMNIEYGCSRFILPALMPMRIDAIWLSYQRQIIDAARMAARGLKLILSLPMTAESMKSDEQIQMILDFVSEVKPDGVYILSEHPNNAYFVDDATWLKNMLELIAGCKLRGLEVIVGYCNPQSLIFSCAGADYIMSGNWMNVRMFNHKKFMESDGIKMNKTPWFYFPQMLSEFKRATLDIAKDKSYLAKMRYPIEFSNVDGDKVFNHAVQPSQVLNFPESFRHYLLTLKIQVEESKKDTYTDTLDFNRKMVNHAKSVVEAAQANGIRAEGRDILPTIDAMESALDVLDFRRGGQLRRNWKKF